jgi:type IV secretory pathway VirB2 component (pilin)
VAKIIIVLGLVIILASIIAGTRFVFQRRTLYEYLLMLVFIFGGAAITLSMLLSEKDK